MFKSIRIRAAVTILICLAALVYLAPSLTADLPEAWKKYLPTDRIHLGLDLQGGMHLVLEVDTEKAVESTLDRSMNDLKEHLMDQRVRFRFHERTREKGPSFEFPDSASRDAFDKVLHDQYPDLETAGSQIIEGKGLVSLKIKEKRAADIRKMAVEQSLETIRNRVDQFGISEPEIIPQGTDRIIVQLPGVKDPSRAKNLSAERPCWSSSSSTRNTAWTRPSRETSRKEASSPMKPGWTVLPDGGPRFPSF